MHKPVVIRKAINRSRRTYEDGRRWLLPYKYPGARLTPLRFSITGTVASNEAAV